MKVYKFGGASVRSAEGIRNMAAIVKAVSATPLFIVVSAMGKTTNALEEVLAHFMKTDREAALEKLREVEDYHKKIIAELFETPEPALEQIDTLFHELRNYVQEAIGDDYDRCYDHLVSYGELISTRIVSSFLLEAGVGNMFLDMRKLLVTDSNFREANVRMEDSEKRFAQALDFSRCPVYVAQGFIAANSKGDPTTLGREGSDYSAAVVGNLLNAESVTIWKDVPGILNADPRIFPDTVLIPRLTYYDAVELAYSGAQVIHPKTIKPLRNKKIPLYVRPFAAPDEAGSVIGEAAPPIDVPVLILKKNQVLATMRPRDFSFVLEESLSGLFAVLNKHRIKVSLVQSSAVSISVCMDNTRQLSDALDELANDFKVSYNSGLELLTIRGWKKEVIERTTSGRELLLSQQTRRIARFLMKENTDC